MLHRRFTRLTVAALAASALLAGGFAFAGSAQGSPVIKIKCSHLTGTVTGNVSASGCTSNGANTGGGSVPQSASTLASGGTVHWLSGKTTTIDKPTLTGETDNGETPGTTGCATGSSEQEVSGHVIADTSGLSPVPGKFKAEVCIDGSQNISLEPGTKLKAT